MVSGYRDRYYINGCIRKRGTRLYEIEAIDGYKQAIELFAAYQAKYPKAIFKNAIKVNP